MRAKPIVEALREHVRQRFADDLDLDWILPRAERGGTSLAIVVRKAVAPGLLDAPGWGLDVLATCAVGGSDDAAFDRLDRLQDAVSSLATDHPDHQALIAAGDDSWRIVRGTLEGLEWGEAEQGDVRLCEVRLALVVIAS